MAGKKIRFLQRGESYPYLTGQMANMTTRGAGSKISGKSDMNMMNLFIPGEQVKTPAARLLARVTETGRPGLT